MSTNNYNTVPNHLNLNVDLNALFSNSRPPHASSSSSVAAALGGQDGSSFMLRQNLASVLSMQDSATHAHDAAGGTLFRNRNIEESPIDHTQAAQIISSLSAPKLNVPGREAIASVPSYTKSNSEISSGIVPADEHNTDDYDDDNDPYKGYRDFSELPDTTETDAKDTDGSDFGGTTSKTPNIANFPMKLHEILSREEFSNIVTWAPHGRSWRVLKPKTFESKILPQFFRHGKYNSFTRQVNGWGFRRITQGPDHNTYYHEFFLRGLPHLCKRMKRVPATGGKISEGTGKYPEPDFYRIHEINPLPDERTRDNGGAVSNSALTSSNDALIKTLLSDPRRAAISLRDLGLRHSDGLPAPPPPASAQVSESAINSLLMNTSAAAGEQPRSLLNSLSRLPSSGGSLHPAISVSRLPGLNNYHLLGAVDNQRLLSGVRAREQYLRDITAASRTAAASNTIDPLLARLQVEAASSHLINSRHTLLAAVCQEQQILAQSRSQAQAAAAAAVGTRPQMSAIERVLLMEALRRRATGSAHETS